MTIEISWLTNLPRTDTFQLGVHQLSALVMTQSLGWMDLGLGSCDILILTISPSCVIPYILTSSHQTHVLILFSILHKLITVLTFAWGQWVNSNGSAHFLKLFPKLWVFLDFIFVFCSKIFQMLTKFFHLKGHLEERKHSLVS